MISVFLREVQQEWETVSMRKEVFDPAKPFSIGSSGEENQKKEFGKLFTLLAISAECPDTYHQATFF